MAAGFDQDDFQHFLDELKRSLADLEAVQARQLRIEEAVLHPGALKNNSYPDDVTYKGIVRDDQDQPAAFLLCSNPIGPELVAQNVEQARIAKQSLSSDLHTVIDLPFASGAFQGISWALYDVHRPLSDRKFIWRVQRLLLSPRIITWLNRILAHTKTEFAEQDLHDRVRVPLQFFQKDYDFPEDMQKRAATALKRLDAGSWRPCACLAHNDLWKGNVMLPYGKADGNSRFYLIDWAGSSPKGVPLFDVFKFCQSFQVPQFVIRRTVKKHCALLDCELEDALSYLITALAVLGSNLNQFPRDAYMKLAKELFALGNSVIT